MYVTPHPDPRPPRDAALRLARLPGLAWLDGGLSHGREGRFSFVAAAPVEVVAHAVGDGRVLESLARLGAETEADLAGAELAASAVPRWIGYLGYEALGAIGTARERALPGVRFARYDALYAYDHATEHAWLVGDDADACAQLATRLAAAPVEALGFETSGLAATEPEAHRRAIQGALAHIREGDIYQINLARRFRAGFRGSPLGLFLRMRSESPVPLGLYLDAEDHCLLGRSMERFLRYRPGDGSLATSPIKGTLRRDGDDRAEAEALRADPKEHAEHAMIVDLMRNDLGRVAEYGSVVVSELMAVLPFAGLSHLVSTVTARATPKLGLDALLAATFPPGSVTGTPKRRALELIAELEPFARELYTGAYGFVDRSGGCSLAVAIRTAVTEGRGEAGRVTYFAGGGIVEASCPERETAETELKAQVFLRALG